jgi:hypothetical protein
MERTIGIIFNTLVVFLLSLTSCTSTKLTSVWKDNTHEGYIDTLMVVAVTENSRNRLIFEREFVEELNKTGIKAIASIDVIPPEKAAHEGAILTAAQKREISMIMVTHLIGVKDEEVYHPPKTRTVPRGGYYGRFNSYYPRVYEYVHEPGYYTKHKSVNLETNLYETKTQKLLWSVTSATLDPESVNTIIESLSKVVIKNLRKHNLLH